MLYTLYLCRDDEGRVKKFLMAAEVLYPLQRELKRVSLDAIKKNYIRVWWPTQLSFSRKNNCAYPLKGEGEVIIPWSLSFSTFGNGFADIPIHCFFHGALHLPGQQ